MVPKEVFDEMEKINRRNLAQEIQKCPDPEVKKAEVEEHKKFKRRESFFIDECLDVIPLEAVVYVPHKLRLQVAKRIRFRRKVAAMDAEAPIPEHPDHKDLLPEWVQGLLLPEQKLKVLHKLSNMKKEKKK